jgi:hypothetical protein
MVRLYNRLNGCPWWISWQRWISLFNSRACGAWPLNGHLQQSRLWPASMRFISFVQLAWRLLHNVNSRSCTYELLYDFVNIINTFFKLGQLDSHQPSSIRHDTDAFGTSEVRKCEAVLDGKVDVIISFEIRSNGWDAQGVPECAVCGRELQHVI